MIKSLIVINGLPNKLSYASLGSGILNGQFEYKAHRSVSGERGLAATRPVHPLAEIMRDLEGDHGPSKRLAARRLFSVLLGQVTRLYYRVMLRLTRERDELNSSSAVKQDVTVSRRSSNGTIELLSLTRRFRRSLTSQPYMNVRQFAALIGKKLFLAKLDPFQRLKRHLQKVRLHRQNILKGAQNLKDIM